MIKYFISGVFLVSLGFSVDVNFSLETKYGDGSKVTGQASNNPDTTDYNFIENILDINTIFDNGVFISTQLEYSDPPIFGTPVMGHNNFILDYMGNNYSIKMGNLYSLYGRGLSLNMAQNQNIDYDNSLVGIESQYTYNDISLFGLIGQSKFKYRSNPVDSIPNLQLDNKVFFIGSEIFTSSLGIYLVSYLHQTSDIGEDVIYSYWEQELFDAGKDLYVRYNAEDDDPTNDILPEGEDRLVTKDFNVSWTYQFFGIDFYIEKVWNTYTKILGDTVSGSKLYLSSYFNIAEIGVTYEYKNYDQKYHIPTLAGPPIGFREGNSTLASRNSHSINWGDEVGHQIELNRSIGAFQWMGNLSFAYKHAIDGHESVSFSQILRMEKDDDIYHQYPFRQLYSEISGYTLNDKLYFKLGVDKVDEFKGYEKPSISALTFPSMLTYNLGGGNSITTYIERQNRVQQELDENMIISENVDFINNYFSFTFNYLNHLSVSFFYDDEITNKSNWSPSNYPEELCLEDGWNWNGSICSNIEDEKFNKWVGYDISYKINSTSQVSLFYGSQKGGLVCANGVCAEQPGFDDGIKVTLRSIF